MPRSLGHTFYDRAQELLRESGFDAFVEQVCKPYYAPRMGAPSPPLGQCVRMHMIGYSEFRNRVDVESLYRRGQLRSVMSSIIRRRKGLIWAVGKATQREPLAKFIERGEFSLCSRGGAAGVQAGAGLSCVTRSI